jgi:hypothetical protein
VVIYPEKYRKERKIKGKRKKREPLVRLEP